ncbi:MAG: vWA domain-containing protein [Micropepsaceae bacterium]
MTHQVSSFRRRLAASAAVTVLALGTLALSGCEQQPAQTKQKDARAEPKAAPENYLSMAQPKASDGRALGLQPNSAPANSQAAPESYMQGMVAPAAPSEGFRYSQGSKFGLNDIAGGFESRPTPYAQYMQPPQGQPSYDKFPGAKPNAVKLTVVEPLSTFSADVDTASYAVVRKFLSGGSLPPTDAVRIEEMVNYFEYSYPLPETREQPFRPTVAVYRTPWNPDTQIVHIGIKGFDIAREQRPPANLVFLLDVSGSMASQDKLPLVQKSMRLLVNELGAKDRVSIVVYAGAAGMVLEPTPGTDKETILAAIDNLSSGGSTAGAEGIRQAYELARTSFIKSGVNRVILATDGDFNVGITDPEQLEAFVARERENGVTLTCLGFGTGNYNDALMQKLAQKGNGNAAYIDTLNEGRKVLVEQVGGTLFTIAKDVKFQVEFNPARVNEYRLIGYETRLLNREDFNNDKIDAGDIGAGHAVTALYEIVPAGSKAHMIDPLRYEAVKRPAPTTATGGEIAFLKMRYKLPSQDKSRLIERPITNSDIIADVKNAPADLRFAAAVAGFGQLLRADPHLKNFNLKNVVALAADARGPDESGYRAEFVQMVKLAQSLSLNRNGTGGPP